MCCLSRLKRNNNINNISQFFSQRFNDSIYQRAPWVTAFNFSTIVRKWHHKNKEMRNSKNYGIRLFVLRLPNATDKEALDREMVIEMGQDICEELNNTPSYYSSTIKVDPENYFWADDAVFADIYGDEDAYKELIYHCPPTGDGDYYEKNADIVSLFFREGQFPPNRAKQLNMKEDCYQDHPSHKKSSAGKTTVTVVVN